MPFLLLAIKKARELTFSFNYKDCAGIKEKGKAVGVNYISGLSELTEQRGDGAAANERFNIILFVTAFFCQILSQILTLQQQLADEKFNIFLSVGSVKEGEAAKKRLRLRRKTNSNGNLFSFRGNYQNSFLLGEFYSERQSYLEDVGRTHLKHNRSRFFL